MKRLLFPAILLVATGCAAVPRPTILREVDATRTAAATQEAARGAPQAYLAAEKLRHLADQALSDGDRTGSEILGEQGLAAYARARALSRLASAEERTSRAKAGLVRAAGDLSSVEAELQKVTAEAADLEARVRAERDAVPVSPSEPASADREKARLSAARALASEARLLCVAAGLLAPDTASVAEATTALDALDADLAKSPLRAPIDTAVRLRARCLDELTRVRQKATSAAPEAGMTDALLAELSQASYEPGRDDRGVVVVLRGVFQGAGLAKESAEKLTGLGQVARTHPDVPVLVVVHTGKGRATGRDLDRAKLVTEALKAAGAPRAEPRAAGDALPVAPPGVPAAASRNERVEIVFVPRAL